MTSEPYFHEEYDQEDRDNLYLYYKKPAPKNSKMHFDYICRKKHINDLVYTQSGNMPAWADGAADFWQKADQHRDPNLQAHREVTMKFPSEFSLTENIKQVEQFLKRTGISQNHAYTYAIHYDPAQKNPYVHLMFNNKIIEKDRPLGPENYFKTYAYHIKTGEPTGGYKSSVYFEHFETGSLAWDQTRKIWADLCNQKFKQKGLDTQIDCHYDFYYEMFKNDTYAENQDRKHIAIECEPPEELIEKYTHFAAGKGITEIPDDGTINYTFEIAGIKGFGNPDLPFNLNSALSEMLDSREVKKDINGVGYEEYSKFDEFALKVCIFLKENFQDKQKDSGKVLIQMGDVTKSEENTRLDFAVLSDKNKSDFISFRASTTQSQQPEQESQFKITCSLSKESAALFADMLASNEFRKLGLVFKNLEKVNEFIQQYGSRSQDQNIPTLELKNTNNAETLELKGSNNTIGNTLQLKSEAVFKEIKSVYKKIKGVK